VTLLSRWQSNGLATWSGLEPGGTPSIIAALILNYTGCKQHRRTVYPWTGPFLFIPLGPIPAGSLRLSSY